MKCLEYIYIVCTVIDYCHGDTCIYMYTEFLYIFYSFIHIVLAFHMLLFVTIQPHPLNGVLLSLLVNLELVCAYMEKVLSLLIKYVPTYM